MMSKVNLFHRAGRPFFEAQWRDPVTGLKKTRSTKTAIRREAERFAARLEEKLAGGETASRVTVTAWTTATEMYAAEVFGSQAKKTSDKMRGTWRLVEKIVSPASVGVVEEQQVGEIVSRLQAESRSAYTIKGHLSKLRIFLQWAFDSRLIKRMPKVKARFRNVAPNRGRPITREELDRMLKATRKVVGKQRAASYRAFLQGLWLSGLRLSEALELHWTDEKLMSVDLRGKHPMFRVQAAGDKARKFRLLAMVPGFYRFLIRERDRRGFVFKLAGDKGGRPTMDTLSKTICAIGKKAGVKVSESRRGTKYASAHDLRRAFGFRWAMRVRAPVLMQLMRHDCITTTMQFYARQDADAGAEEVWRGRTNDLANGRPKRHSQATPEPSENTAIPEEK